MLKKKILLIDDDPSRINKFRSLLDSDELAVVIAPNAFLAQVYMRAGQANVNAIFCTEQLSDAQGSGLAAGYREKGGSVPFVLMSGNLDAVQITELMKSNAICAHLPLTATPAQIVAIATIALRVQNKNFWSD